MIEVKNTSRRAAGIELTLFLALVLSYIWIWAGSFKGALVVVYVAGLGLTLGTHLIHRETAWDLGVRLDNVWASLKDCAVPTLPLVGFFLALGFANGHWSAEALDPSRFLRVVAWGFIQQYLLQGFIHRRLAVLIEKPLPRELAVAGIFAALHLPNPVLVPVTFLAGYVFAVLYRRQPNLVVLALCHAVGSTAVAFAFDPASLHRMRVGPGYLRF
ncbi:MAG TPA: CPBP family glutamic-type intramembrane protease [Candidatus Polarisedimenticolia bacterium]|nr:CPBP family glutamic-type intramembrane protease [Candidatus Polarisedimenticolia bacterium]